MSNLRLNPLAAIVLFIANSHAAFAEDTFFPVLGNTCSFALTTESARIEDNEFSKKIPIEKCGKSLNHQAGYLTRDLNCNEKDLNADGAAISLIESTLDLNGKNITFKNNESARDLNSGIYITKKSKVYDSKKKSAKITGFYTGIEVLGDNNEIHALEIEKTIIGINIHGFNNKIKNVNVKNIGGIIDSDSSLIVGEGKGFIIAGDHNQIIDTKSKNIGFNGENATPVNSMFGFAASINITGDHNVVEHHTAENIFITTKGILNAQSSVWGIYVMGNYNIVEQSYIEKVNAIGIRQGLEGLQTGGLAYGIMLSNPPNDMGHNTVFCNTVYDVYAEGKKLTNLEEPSYSITAESYGIAGFSNDQQIKNNHVEKIDAKADYVVSASGIRIVEQCHVVQNNAIENVGKLSFSSKIIPDKENFVSGISIDASYSRVVQNKVNDTLGDGINVSLLGSNNVIRDNKSRKNVYYDYIENGVFTGNCRNEWIGNELEHTLYFPESCFSAT